MDEQITGAIKQYIIDVKSRDFPNEQESYWWFLCCNW
jgi:ketopantoate hydroxymethyltransferase